MTLGTSPHAVPFRLFGRNAVKVSKLTQTTSPVTADPIFVQGEKPSASSSIRPITRNKNQAPASESGPYHRTEMGRFRDARLHKIDADNPFQEPLVNFRYLVALALD